MTETFKILAQVYPTLLTLTTGYTVPAVTSASISSVVVCNQGGVADTIRVSVAVAGAADATKQYIYYDLSVPSKETFICTIGVTLATTDVLRVYSTTGTSSFNVFGVEIT